jgi:hypothetical protein
VEVERIAHQSVERVGRNRDHFAPPDSGRRALDGALGRLLRVNFDEVGGHV